MTQVVSAIHHATIITPHEVIDDGTVLIDNGVITEVRQTLPTDKGGLDAQGLYLTPGFVDLQINGAFGKDFTEAPESIWEVAEELPRFGITSFLPTIISSPFDVISHAQNVVTSKSNRKKLGATPIGLHLEGPFLNPMKKGAHDSQYLRQPDLELASSWSPQNGVRMVTLAPELPGAKALIRNLTKQEVVVSAGHSMASFQEAKDAITSGVRYGTHLFNAMAPLHHREPGLIGALLEDEKTVIGMIVDDIHVHSAMVKVVWENTKLGRLNLVSDAIAALGMPPGTYTLGGQDVMVDNTTCRLEDGTLAGSILPLSKALSNLIRITSCTLPEAVTSVTSTPSDLLSLIHQKGQIDVGYDADLVLLSMDIEVIATIIDASIAYENGEHRISIINLAN